MLKNLSNKSFYCLLLLTVLFIRDVAGQNTFSSEDDLKKAARKLFDNEQYVEAYPLYSQLLSVYPKDPNYNYRFGICMLYTSENKEKPISFLEYASKQPDVEKDVFFFLGRAYHLNYRFDDAIAAFNRFKKEASAYQQKKLQVDQQMEMCRNGKTLLRNITELDVLDKKRLADKDFFRPYDLSSIGGKLLIKPEEFQSQLDKKAKEQSIIYLAKNNNQIYYSSYGVDGKNGKDIYVVKKMPGGEWSSPVNLGTTINTSLDEDYPFLHPNGKVLYFSSKGHNSMGGYDIFKSTWNDLTLSWNPPVNMDFSINTPDDDIMYVTDSLEKTATFSSRRSSPNGMLDVYRINTERKPVEVAIINGSIGKDSEGHYPKSKLTVKNASTGELIGIVNSDPQNGQYSLNVPGGSKLLLTVESEGYKTQSEVVVLPLQQVFKPFRQEMNYDEKTDKLEVKNFFDEAIDDNNYLSALNYIKEMAKMDVNANETIGRKAAEQDTLKAGKDSVLSRIAEPGSGQSMSDNALVKIAYDDAADVQKEAKEIKNQADLALGYANQRNKEAQVKYSDADAAARQGDKENAADLRKEGDKISKETVASFNLAKKLESDASVQQDEADLSLDYAKELESASKSNSSVALKQLEEQKKRIESMNLKPKGTENAYNSIKSDAENKQKEVDQTKDVSESLKKEIAGMDTQINKLNADIAVTDNSQLKEGLRGQAKDLEVEKTKKQAELAANESKIIPLENEAANLKNESELVMNVISQIKAGSDAPVNLSADDKQKLQEQVNGYKMKENPLPTTGIAGTSSAVSSSTTGAAVTSPAATVPKDTALVSAQSYNRKYDSKLKEANDINDDYTRETTKASYYKSWSDSINRTVFDKNAELGKTRDETVKKKLEQEITVLEAQADEKLQLSEVSRKKAKESISGGVVVVSSTNPDSVARISGKDTSSTVALVTPRTAKTSVINKPEQPVILKDTVLKSPQSLESIPKPATVVSNPASGVSNPAVIDSNPTETQKPVNTAIKDTVKSTSLIAETRKEGEDLMASATHIRNEANAQTDPVQRNHLLEEAGKIEQNAIQKQQTVADAKAKLKTDEFNKNNEQLADYSKEFGNNSSDDVTRAGMLKDESDYYFDLAQKARAKPAQNISYSNRQNQLDKADENEKTALEKQAKAKELYSKIKPDSTGPVVSTQQKAQKNVLIITQSKGAKVTGTATTKTTTPSVSSGTNSVSPGTTQSKKAAVSPVTQSSDIQQTSTSTPALSASSASTSTSTSTSTSSSSSDFLTPKQMQDIQGTKEYADYKELRVQSDSTMHSAKMQYRIAEEFHKQANSRNKLADPILKIIDSIPAGSVVPDSLTKLAVQFKAEGGVYQLRADSVMLIAKNEEDEAKAKSGEAELYLHSLNKSVYQHIVLAYNGKVASNASASARNNEASGTVIEAEGISLNKVNLYSDQHPIPINTKLPSGLIFKVQIGAFRKAIQQNLFKGMNPITGETTPTGIIRYAAGLFSELPSAVKAKDKVKGMGYKDAFIVAFYNGKRITFEAAMELLKKKGSTIQVKQPPLTPQLAVQQPVVQQPVVQQPAVQQQAGIAKTTDIATVAGLIYTIQVGVYSKPVTSKQLFNIEPLYTETLNAGLKRYSSGAFTDINSALKAKEEIVAKGIKDAFIIVFKDGKRVTGSEISNNSVAPKVGTEAISGKGIVFKVQIGAYKGEVPIKVANKFIGVSSKGVDITKDEKGMSIYSVGNFKTYEEAVKMKDELVSSGIPDAFVVAYDKTRKVDLKSVIGDR